MGFKLGFRKNRILNSELAVESTPAFVILLFLEWPGSGQRMKKGANEILETRVIFNNLLRQST